MALMKSRAGESQMNDTPRKTAFAIAHGVKKRMGQKKSPAAMVQAQQALSPEEQAHGQVAQPRQPKDSYQSRATNPIRPEPRMGQANFGPEVESQHFSTGGEVKAAMSRRERALLAARGEGYAERYPAGESSSNPGPSIRSTRMPLSPEEVAAGPPSSEQISKEEQAMFAKGGPVGMADYHRQRAAHYEKMAEGGAVPARPLAIESAKPLEVEAEDPEKREKNEVPQSGAGAMQQGMKDLIKGSSKSMGFGKKKMAFGGYADPEMSDDEQSQSFALGGQSTGSSIAKRIREGKRMAFGGRAHTDDDRPEDGESIDNFRREDHPDNDFLSGEEQTDYHHLNAGDLDEEAEIPKRKGMLDRIMRGIHARNGNR